MLPAFSKGTIFLIVSMQEKFNRLQINIKLEKSPLEYYINKTEIYF